MGFKEKSGKAKPKNVNTSNYLRHAVFFVIVICFGVLVKRNPWILKDILSVRVTRHRIASNQETEKVYTKLSSIFGERVTRDYEVLQKYSVDRSHHSKGSPDMIIFPETREEIQTIMKICYRHNMVVIPMGFNSGLEGQTIAYDGGVVINMLQMKKIVEFYEDDLQITVEPGIRVIELNDYLEPLGYYFPVIPASRPSIGGAVSTGASGTTSIKYGTIKKNVVKLEVVLPNGDTFWTTTNRAPKSAAGYDLTSLFIGSEGTFGVITKVTLNIVRKPPAISACIVHFKSLEDAAINVIALRKANIPGLARMEIVNVQAIDAVNRFNNKSFTLTPHLFLEFHGNSDEEVAQYAKQAEIISKDNKGGEFHFTVDEAERKELWFIRNNAYFAASRYRDDENDGKGCEGCRLFSTDVCVPVSFFAKVISETEVDFQQNCQLKAPIVGHSGDGNFHVLVSIDHGNPDEMKRLEECNERLIKRALSHEGTCTGEHGIGIGKIEDLREEVGNTALKVMKEVKMAIDKKNMMNPNKVLPKDI